MSDPQRDDPVATYVRVLQEFGLGDEEIVTLHGDDPGVSDPDAVSHVRLALDDTSARALAERLPSTLAQSDRGMDAPAKFWRPVPAVQLSEVLGPFGYDVSCGFQDEGGSRQLRLSVEDIAAGRVRLREFAYPEGPLGEYNYPAVVAAIESMLDAGSLSFLLLDGPDDRWQFFVTEDDTETALRSEFGDRVSVFDRPVLAPDQPAAFADGAPEWAVDRLPDPVTGRYDGDDTDQGATARDRTDSSTGLDGPAWLRNAAAREGGIDEVVARLSEGGPRTHVSDRSADDVIAEVPGQPSAGRRTATGTGTEDVIENLGTTPDGEAGPARTVSNRPVEVPWSDAGTPKEEPSASGAPGNVASDDGSTATALAGSNSLAGGGVEEVVVEGGVDELLAAVDDDASGSLGTDDPDDHENHDTKGLNGLFASLEDAAADLETPSEQREARTDEDVNGRDSQKTVDVEDVVEMVANDEVESLFAAESGDDTTAGAFADISDQADADPDAVLADEDSEVPVDELIEEANGASVAPGVDSSPDERPPEDPDPLSGVAESETPDATTAPLIVDAESGTAVAGGGDTGAPGSVETAPESRDGEAQSNGSPPDASTVAEVVREAEDEDPEYETVDEGLSEKGGDAEGESGVVARIRSLFDRMVDQTLPRFASD